MAYMLQQDGIFTQNCANLSVLLGPGNLTVNGTYEVAGNHTWAQDTGCDEQRSSIALAFTFATILLGIMAFPNGVIFDKYGLRVTRCLATYVNSVYQPLLLHSVHMVKNVFDSFFVYKSE